MKKCIAFALVLVMLLSLTACDSTDYKEAMALYDAGQFEAARTMFVALGDYEDSALMVKKCTYAIAQHLLVEEKYDEAEAELIQLGDYEDSAQLLAKIPFQKVYAALMASGEIEDTSTSGTIKTVSAEDGYIYAAYGMTMSYTGILSMQIIAVVQIDEAGNVIVVSEAESWSYAADEESEAKGVLDAANYKKGDVITWDTFDGSGYNANGLISSTNSTITTLGDSAVGNAVGALATYLEGSDLGVSMADLGFTSYEG